MQKEKISQGIILSIIVFVVFITFNKDTSIEEIFFSETIPFYRIEMQNDIFFKLLMGNEEAEESVEVFENTLTIHNDIINEINLEEEDNELIGLLDVIYQGELEKTEAPNYNINNVTIDNIEELKNIDILRNRFYGVERTTSLTAADADLFDVEAFLRADLKINMNESGPKVLIFHTHPYEAYVDSDENNIYDGVFGVGKRLAEILESEYGIRVMHDTSRYDLVNGRVQTLGAYERMEVNVQRILNENPSIEIAIDIHRDGVADENFKFVRIIDGKPTAQIMFVNGLSKLVENGVARPLHNLPNANLATNLAFSFNMQLKANEMFSGLTRKVYLKAYRYSLHMLPKSLLVEVGAQTNTMEEALNAMPPLAKVLAEVVLN